jgi:hypothetical protein
MIGPERFEDLVRDEPNFRSRRAHVEVAAVPATSPQVMRCFQSFRSTTRTRIAL